MGQVQWQDIPTLASSGVGCCSVKENSFQASLMGVPFVKELKFHQSAFFISRMTNFLCKAHSFMTGINEWAVQYHNTKLIWKFMV